MEDPVYMEDHKAILAKHGLKTWAIGIHLVGQRVEDLWAPRLDRFAPPALAGQSENIREWAAEYMKYAVRTAKNMGVGGNRLYRFPGVGVLVFLPPDQRTVMIDKDFKAIGR
ncbi:hypothetical protein Holit_03041 [Hollandina sp. SP2]